MEEKMLPYYYVTSELQLYDVYEKKKNKGIFPRHVRRTLPSIQPLLPTPT